MHLRVKIKFLGAILVQPVRRQNFAGTGAPYILQHLRLCRISQTSPRTESKETLSEVDPALAICCRCFKFRLFAFFTQSGIWISFIFCAKLRTHIWLELEYQRKLLSRKRSQARERKKRERITQRYIPTLYLLWKFLSWRSISAGEGLISRTELELSLKWSPPNQSSRNMSALIMIIIKLSCWHKSL